MFISANTDVYCVIGNPVRHSLSPLLHTFMFEKYGINAIYVAFEVINIDMSLKGIKALGIKGANITLPFKEKAFVLVDKCDEDTSFLESINTVKNAEGELIGYNTDYLGFMDMFKEHVDLSEKKSVAVVGAGGVAVSVIYALYKLGLKKVYVLNRTRERAKRLVRKFKKKLEIVDCNLDNREALSISDVIVNCTSVGLDGNGIPIDLSYVSKPIIIDVIYFDTPLVKKARQMGLLAVNGSDMFIYQAYYSFKIWTGVEFSKSEAKKLIKDLTV